MLDLSDAQEGALNIAFKIADDEGLALVDLKDLKALLMELVSICEKAGFRQMIAVIGDSANTGSVAVHKACGFRMVGTLKDVGWKHGKWLDTVLMQLPLGEGGSEPPDPDSLPGRMETITKTA